MSDLNKRILYISTVTVGLFLTLVLYSGTAYAVVNPTTTLTYPFYYIGQGGIITFDDSVSSPHVTSWSSTQINRITTGVSIMNFDTGNTVNVGTITLTDNKNGIYKSPYVNFTANPSTSYQPYLVVANNQHVFARVTISPPGLPPTNYDSPQSLIKSDDAPTGWPTLKTTQQPFKKTIISCPAGEISSAGDGICDSWKDQVAHPGFLQIPFTDPLNNNIIYKYQCSTVPGVGDPCPHVGEKDIYIEADQLWNQGPDPKTILDLVTAFANAPISPPNCTTWNARHTQPNDCTNTALNLPKPGIVLHLIVDQTAPYYKSEFSTPSAGAPLTVTTDFDKMKTNLFGTYNEKHGLTQSDCGSLSPTSDQCITDILTAKRQVFHYVLFAHWQAGDHGSTGASEIPGNDMMISLGSSTAGGIGTVDEQEGTIMHELGHNLGLYHGGEYPTLVPADDSYLNCKPNYPSVMSYARQFSILDTGRHLDYSRDTNSPLSETGTLMEMGTAGPPVTNPGGSMVIFGINDPHIQYPLIPTNPYIRMAPADGIVDWDQDSSNGIENTPSPNLNINNLGVKGCNVYAGLTGALTQLNDFNDWSNLVFNQTLSTAFYDGAPIAVSLNPTIESSGDPNRLPTDDNNRVVGAPDRGHAIIVHVGAGPAIQMHRYVPDKFGFVDQEDVVHIHAADKGDPASIQQIRINRPDFEQENGISFEAVKSMMSSRIAQLDDVITKAVDDKVLNPNDEGKLHAKVKTMNDLIMKGSLYDVTQQINDIKTTITEAYEQYNNQSSNTETPYPTMNATQIIDDVQSAIEKQFTPGTPIPNTDFPFPAKWINYNLNPSNSKCNYGFVLLNTARSDPSTQYVCVMPDHANKIIQNTKWILYVST
ncbi:MAG: hypothetical protein ACREAD_04375 [Nitrosopumilaceae archaeon]